MYFSFIIPALNEEAYIAGCVDSIVKQEGNDFEVIVVDNGSTDDTTKIAKSHGAKVIHELEKGISFARNAGVKAAVGDILCFIDADGLLSKDWLKHARKALNNPTVDAVIGLAIYANENPLKKIWFNTYTFVAYGGLLFSNTFLNIPFLGANNTAVRREIYQMIGGFENVVGEDYWLTKKYLALPQRQKVFVALPMITQYSSRGFEKSGYLKTLFFWGYGALSRKSQKGYTYCNKDFKK